MVEATIINWQLDNAWQTVSANGIDIRHTSFKQLINLFTMMIVKSKEY